MVIGSKVSKDSQTQYSNGEMSSSQISSTEFRIGFIIAYEESPYAGVVRPFINWAKELGRRGLEADMVLYRTNYRILNYVEEFKLGHHVVNNLKGLRDTLRENDYNYVFIDDYIRRLKLVDTIIRYSKLIIYAQVLHGIHAVSPVYKYSALPLLNRLLYAIASITPFSLIRSKYSNRVLKANMVIANSETTRTLLYSLYGIAAHGVVYPPVDTEIFKPLDTPKKDQIVLYLGSHGGDTDPRLLEKICRILEDKGINVITLGNTRLARKMTIYRCKARYVSDLPDMELAKLYSESLVTIAPQLWEQFGYVIAESIACGTPVITFNAMGPAEISRLTNSVLLANNEDEFLGIIDRLKETLRELKRKNIEPHNLPFSSRSSANTLIKVISHHSLV